MLPMRKHKLTSPVAQSVCLHLDNLKPLKVIPGIYMNWETGLVHHKDKTCNKPLLEQVQECWGCEEYFWGNKNSLYCVECSPIPSPVRDNV